MGVLSPFGTCPKCYGSIPIQAGGRREQVVKEISTSQVNYSRKIPSSQSQTHEYRLNETKYKFFTSVCLHCKFSTTKKEVDDFFLILKQCFF